MQELNNLIVEISKPRLLAKDERAVSIGTIHSAKGQESDVVMVTGAIDGMLPHQMSDNVLEEMNLWYVAVTRAKYELYISSFLSFGKKEYKGTQFIDIIK
jgi:DNA helicase-2/ATP-dependent DNA helicase PcrA